MPGKPAPKGNRRAVTHAAHARVHPERREAMATALAAACPVRENGQLPAADEPAVQMLATALIRLGDVGAWLDAHGALARRATRRRPARAERRLQPPPLKLMSALGLTPASRVRIGAQLTATVDLATALSHPDEAKRAELLADAGLTPGDGGRP